MVRWREGREPTLGCVGSLVVPGAMLLWRTGQENTCPAAARRVRTWTKGPAPGEERRQDQEKCRMKISLTSRRPLLGWLLTLCLVAGLNACGGGGSSSSGASASGSGGTAPTAGVFSGTFKPASINTSNVTGYALQMPYSVDIGYTGTGTLYLVATSDQSIVSSFTGAVADSQLSGTITFQPNLTPGTYNTKVVLHACLDSKCASEVTGSPVTLPITLVINPNIQVQQQVSLARSGTDPAPSATLPVTIPASAGTVTLTSSGGNGAVTASFDGSQLHINTTQARAGVYTLQLVLQGSASAQYTQTVSVSYTVTAPAGGEQVLAASPDALNLFLPQSGQPTTQVITVTPPTWTSSPVTAQISSDYTHQMSLSSGPGANQYTLSINTAGLIPGIYDAYVQFGAGSTGGSAGVPITLDVTEGFYASGSFNNIYLDARSTTSALQVTAPIITADGSSATWTASTATPWLQVTPASAPTGTATPMVVNIAPVFNGSPSWLFSGNITLDTNQAGVQAQSIQVMVRNQLPQLERTTAVLSGTGGRIYVDGVIAGTNLLASGNLTVSGATLNAASYRMDTRFVGEVGMLALDLSGATPGQPIVVSANTPLISSQVSIAVQAPLQAAAAYQDLPYSAYRPGRYAPGNGAFYFSAPGEVYRWALSAGQWTLNQTAVVGATGVALRPDEQELDVATGSTLQSLDPASLAPINSGAPLRTTAGVANVDAFDGSGPAYLPTIAYASDGRAIASVAPVSGGAQVGYNGIDWIAAPSDTRLLANLVTAPQIGDPGESPIGGQGGTGVALVLSPSGHAIVGSSAAGSVALYLAKHGWWDTAPALTAGVYVVGAADDGQTFVASDGSVHSAATVVGNLNAVLPLSEYAGGFGLTQDGRYGLVYSYEIPLAAGPATNGVLRVVDLSQAPATALAPSAVVAVQALSSPVGCTTTPLASGESCQHTASITLAPGSGTAFILGPRGIAAVPLPSNVAVQTASATAAPRSAKAQGSRVSSVVSRPVGQLRK